jgi:magnesium chelatase family protein
LCPQHKNLKLQNKCTCTEAQVEQYQRKISGPMLDRIDLKVLLTTSDDTPQGKRYASSTVKKEIEKARDKQFRRYEKSQMIHCNGDLEASAQLREFGLSMEKSTLAHFKKVNSRLDISPRLQDKLHFVSQTISDLDGAPRIHNHHIEEAVNLMGLDNKYFRAMH